MDPSVEHDAALIVASQAYARLVRQLGRPRWLPPPLRAPLALPREAVEVIVDYDRIADRNDAYWDRTPASGETSNLFLEQSQGLACKQAARLDLSVDDWLRLARGVHRILTAGKQ